MRGNGQRFTGLSRGNLRPDGFGSVVDALAANPGAGVLVIEGKIIDRPHLKKKPGPADAPMTVA